MATKNTLQDVAFAEQYLEFVSRRGPTPEARARARVLLATIGILDIHHPTWRTDLIATLDAKDISREVERMFRLPAPDGGTLFSDFIKLITEPRHKGADNE